MQPTCLRAISCMGFFWGVIGSKDLIPAINPNAGDVSAIWSFRNSFWHRMLLALGNSVLALLFLSGDSQVVPSVVPGIEVPVIDGAAIRYVHSHQNEDDLMNVEALLHPIQSEGNAVVSWSAIRPEGWRSSRLSSVVHVVPTPLNFSLEVLSRSFRPEQYAGLGVVGKGLAEAGLEGYHVGSRAFSFHGLLDVSVRRMGADTPIAPPMYPTFPQEATA